MSAVEAPVLLGRICSSWRSISLSTPRLWSKLHVVEPSSYPEQPHGLFAEKLAQRLETTKTWLRSIRPYGMRGMSPGSSEQLVRLFFPFTARWEHIAFVIPPSAVISTMSHLTQADVPMLQSVKLHTTGDYVQWGALGFLRSPAIYSVNISERSLIPSKLPLRWERLTALSLIPEGWDAAMRSDTSLKLLSQCPHLRICRLVPDKPPILELSFLHRLDLKCVGPRLSLIIFQLFSQLSPAGKYLYLTGPLLAAAPHLERLGLGIKKLYSRSVFAELLRGLPPTLHHLEVRKEQENIPIYDSDTLNDEIFESLIPSSNFPTPCPGLQVLEITYPCSVSDETLLRFINARTLKRVTIPFQRAKGLDIHSELRPLVQSGLQLELTYSAPVFGFSPWDGLEDRPDLE
ncbi:hypothetical protein FB451DRAFT_1305128 [Mycena latifolia]|nr:hypothetical protein FB451DRAFT_1305128 [Mycena latifolia]